MRGEGGSESTCRGREVWRRRRPEKKLVSSRASEKVYTYIGASIVASNPAEVAPPTGNSRLHGYAISFLESLDAGSNLENLSRGC